MMRRTVTTDQPGAAVAREARSFNWPGAVMVLYPLWHHLVELVVEGFTDGPVSIDVTRVVVAVAAALVVGLRYRPTMHWALVGIWLLLMAVVHAGLSAVV